MPGEEAPNISGQEHITPAESKVAEMLGVNAVWHGPEGDLPAEIEGEPQKDPSTGRDYVRVRWWAGQNYENSGVSYAPADEMLRQGQTVKVRRSGGELEDDWTIYSVGLWNGPLRLMVSKPSAETGKELLKEIPSYDLWQQQVEDEAEKTTRIEVRQELPTAEEAARLDPKIVQAAQEQLGNPPKEQIHYRANGHDFVANVVKKVRNTAGETTYTLENPENPGTFYYAAESEILPLGGPAAESPDTTVAETSAVDTGESEDEPEPAESESLARAEQKVAELESELAEVEAKAAEAKQKAKEALDNNQFDKSISLTREAANRHKRANALRKNLNNRQRYLAAFKELLAAQNILDLKDKFDSQLKAEQDRRRQHPNLYLDAAPMTEYAEMLRGHLIDQYLAVVKTGGKNGRLPMYDIKQEIIGLMGKENDELEKETPKDDQLFYAGQRVQAFLDGTMQPGWIVEGYEDRPDGRRVKLINPAASREILAPENLLHNWQQAPAGTPAENPSVNPPPGTGGEGVEDTGGSGPGGAAPPETPPPAGGGTDDFFGGEGGPADDTDTRTKPKSIRKPRLPMYAFDRRIREALNKLSPKRKAAVIGLGLLAGSVVSPVGIGGALIYRTGLSVDSFNDRRYRKRVEEALERQRRAEERAKREAAARASAES